MKAPSGCATAAQAMELLADQVPDRRADCLDKAAALRQRQYEAAKKRDKAKAAEELLETLLAAADAKAGIHATADAIALYRRALPLASAMGQEKKGEVQSRLDRVLARQRVEKQVGDLKTKLRASPDDTPTRKELVRLCLVELDDPAQAATFLNESCDEPMRKYIPAVAKGVQDAPELACVELGDWYLGLSDKASTTGKGAMMARAYAYYDRFLSLHKTEDSARSEALMARKKVEEGLAKFGETRADVPSPWVDLLKLTDPAKHTIESTWEFKAGALVLNGNGRLDFPCVPQGSYELLVVLTGLEGAMISRILLPVGSNGVVVEFGPSGGRMFAARSAVQMLSTGALIKGQEYALDIRVTQTKDQAEITVNLNDKPYMHCQGPQSGFDIPHDVRPAQPVRVGFGSYGPTRTAFKSVRIRMLAAKMKIMK